MRPGTLFLGMVLAAGWPAAALAQLHFPQPVADWGDIKRGPSLVQRFPFVVHGDRAIEIEGVKASCGCLTPRIPRQVLEPGQAGTIDLEINTLSQPPGPNSWRATVTYHFVGLHGEPVEATLQVQARLRAELAVEPAALNLITDKPTAHVITLVDFRPQPLQVTAVQASKPELLARLLPPRRDEQGHIVHAVQVQVSPAFPEGRHDEVISFYTSDPEYRELRVPVTVVKRSRERVTATPERLSIPVLPGQESPSRLVLIRDSEGQPVVIDKVVCHHPAVQCRWASAPGGSITLRVIVERTQVGSESFQTEVEAHLSKPTPQVLRIPVSCPVTP